MQCLKPFIFTQSMQKFGQRLRIRNWIFHFDDTFGHVGVDICHAPQSNVFHSLIEGSRHLSDDIVRRSPDGDSFLGLDTEATSPLVSDTSLVDFNLVCQRTRDVWVFGHCLGDCTGLRPSGPFDIGASLMPHLSC